jgi:hypothetical protein
MGLLPASPLATLAAQANQSYFGAPIVVACGACAGVLQGTAIRSAGATAAGTAGQIPGYQGLQSNKDDNILFTPVDRPRSVGERLLEAAGDYFNGAIEGARIVGQSIKDFFVQNESSDGANKPKTPVDILMPNGSPIGTVGDNTGIRILPGGIQAAEDLTLEIGKGGKDITPSGHPGILIQLPNGGGTIGFRPKSQSGPPTVDVNIPGVRIREIKFK